MFNNKQYTVRTVKPKEDEYILVEFEDTKIDQLPTPITLKKDAPQPPSGPEKNEEKRRSIYKSQIANSPFQMSCGERQLEMATIDPITSQPITTEPLQILTSRKYKETDKFAVICVEDGQDPTISVLDEKWIFTKRKQMKTKEANLFTPVYVEDEEKKYKKRPAGDNSEDEQYSHQSDRYADDDSADMDKTRHRNESYQESEESETETEKRKKFVRELLKDQTKDQQPEQIKRPMKGLPVPSAKRNIDQIRDCTRKILERKGKEMFLDEFRSEFVKKINDNYDIEILEMIYDIIKIEGEGANTTICLKKPEEMKKTQRPKKKATSKKTTQK